MMNKMVENDETRVKVWRNKDEFLGYGTLLGCVPISEFRSLEDFKKGVKEFLFKIRKVTPETLTEEEKRFEEHWIELEQDKDYLNKTTPKIRLDNGQIVYGCQIWWEVE
jgi:hypothetical protein